MNINSRIWATLSCCRDCGREVHIINGVRCTRLDRGSVRLVGQDHAYIMHECDPGDVEAHRIRVESAVAVMRSALDDDSDSPSTERREWLQKQVALLGRTEADEHLALTQLVREMALDRRCSKCGAPPSEPCENLIERRRGVVKITKNPHPDRLSELQAAELDPRAAAHRSNLHRLSRDLEEMKDELLASGREEDLRRLLLRALDKLEQLGRH